MSAKNTLNGKPLEFGNKEQISFLQKHESYSLDVLNGKCALTHKNISVKIKVELRFPCIECGSELNIEVESEDQDYLDVEDLTDREGVECTKCEAGYEIYGSVIKCVDNPRNPKKTTK